MDPLAEILRPKSLDEVVGQEHLTAQGMPLRVMVENNKLSSIIFWGPPGSGKTTLARILANSIGASFTELTAVNAGVADVKKTIAEAENQEGQHVLFIDEIHRFNKAQQDSLLSAVERGIVTLIGATTENPGFSVISPLQSRSHIYILKELSTETLLSLFEKAKSNFPTHTFDTDALEFLADIASGDARYGLNALQLAADFDTHITRDVIETALQQKQQRYDKAGDSHYDTISAFIKSMRGSDPDASLHYLARMIAAGEDPLFIARRIVIFASEDIGNAQPTALVLATACMQAVHMIGMPEAQLILAQTVTYLATAKKSIASTEGISAAMHDVKSMPLGSIPLHLRNPANKVMKGAGYGKGHTRYAWKVEKETGQKVEQQYLPDNLVGKKYYEKDWE